MHRLGAVDGDRPALGPAVAGEAEHHPAEHRRGGVVHVHGGLAGADQRLDGALDQLLPGLGQHRDADVVGHPAGLDEAADEVEIGLAGGREADLDLLVAHPDQQVEHGVLARRRSSGRSAPGCRRAGRWTASAGRGGDRARRPLPVGQVDGRERPVAVARHAGRALLVRDCSSDYRLAILVAGEAGWAFTPDFMSARS